MVAELDKDLLSALQEFVHLLDAASRKTGFQVANPVYVQHSDLPFALTLSYGDGRYSLFVESS